jgi:sugar phosphate isomerase/epimerase
MAHPLSLHHLSALNLTAPELVRAAAGAGFDHVCLFTAAWPSKDFDFPVVTRGALERETRAALADTGLSLFDVDPIFLWPSVDVTRYEDALALGAELGAVSATVVVGDPDRNRAADNFAQICEMARPMGISPAVEFMRLAAVRSLAEAVELVTAAGAPARSIAIDMLHLVRTGGSAAEVAALDPALIGNVQLCDGPLTRPEEEQGHEAMHDRALPGMGAFPLANIVAALPEGCPLSVECPNDAERAKHGNALGWAKALHAAAVGFAGFKN